MKNKNAFTLIELLVVVSIIAVLLALLIPAMDKAIYQAELAVCGTKLKAMGSAVNIYAAEQRRSYPVRSWVRQKKNERSPVLAYINSNTLENEDDRSLLSKYMDIDATLNCPLVRPVGLAQPGADADTTVFSTYGLWFGFGYLDPADNNARQKGMDKLGDKLQFGAERFDTLAGDWDGQFEQDNYDYAAHPDREGVMANVPLENSNGGIAVFSKNSFSFWNSPKGVRRGFLDLNYLFTDGGVNRYPDVKPLSRDNNDRDPRMSNLPGGLNAADADQFRGRVQLPHR